MFDTFKPGYTNVIYMSRSLHFSPEAVKLKTKLENMGLKVYNESSIDELHSKRKLCVHRFGHIPDYSYNVIIRKKGTVVSGDICL